MQRKKCCATLGVALTIAIMALTFARGAAGFQFAGGPDGATAGETPALRLAGAAGSQPGGEPGRAGTYNILHLFTWAKYPTGNLIFDATGNLYGTTSQGGGSGCGGSGCGVVYKLARNPKGTWAVSILHAFTFGADGWFPGAGLIFDKAGNLYGTSYEGGAYGGGVVFKLAPNPDGTWTESVLHSFQCCPDGVGPSAGAISDAAGNLYGTTLGGGPDAGGVVFKLAPNPDGTWTESVLHSFTGGADGGMPFAGLILDAAGNLYGTTEYGGSGACDAGCGVVFKLAPDPDGTWTESVLHYFPIGPGVDGGYPSAGLTLDAAGNLYGTATYGGRYDSGVVFKLAPNPDGTWTESVLHSFTGGADGGFPLAGLIFDNAGNLYGTTFGGGPAACPPLGCGVVFKLKPSSSGWSETVLHTFIGFGAGPTAPVIFDRTGNLYGTTYSGNPAFDYGLVFEITR